MDDNRLIKAFDRVPAELQLEIRKQWLNFVETATGPAGVEMFRALTMVGLGDDVVTRHLLHAGAAELALIAYYGLEGHPKLPADMPAAPEMEQFWLVLGAMAAGHLAARAE